MRRTKNPCLAILVALIALLCLFLAGCEDEEVPASNNNLNYKFQFNAYAVTYDISDNCSIFVTEDITVHYFGLKSTGFIRDIPVGKGVQIRDIFVRKVYGIDNKDAWFDVYYQSGDDYFDRFICIDIGDPDIVKYDREERYTISYNLQFTNAAALKENMLSLNAIFHGGGCEIYKANISIFAPKGYLGAKCYVGKSGSTDTATDFKEVLLKDGRTNITFQRNHLAEGVGVTFDLSFDEGVLKAYPLFTNYIYLIVGSAILLVLIVLILFVFNKHRLTPVVNYDAPYNMDPLIMGKLIDNKVNGSDVTSLIYYWAGKGHIKINLDNKDDPVLIRVTQRLPLSSPEYERFMYDNLFKYGDIVRVSHLKNKFYKVVEQTSAQVNNITKGMYNSLSVGISILFAVIGALLLGFTPMIVALTKISPKLIMIAPFLILIPTLVMYALSETLRYYSLKLSKGKMALYSLGICLLWAITGVVYVVFIPAGLLSVPEKIILYVISVMISVLSVFVISRTKEYTEKLNNVIGFRKFILLAEKPQLEKMLEEDPQFYYHILPYAQVLGVTDKWEEKFKDLTIEPPTWLVGDYVMNYFEFTMLNNMLRSVNTRISSELISRPSSSGSGVSGVGGSFGGHSGGGIGGGGVRGR